MDQRGKTKSEIERDITNERFPPFILYKILYTGHAENRVQAWMKVDLHGADVPLSFSCIVGEEKSECFVDEHVV